MAPSLEAISVTCMREGNTGHGGEGMHAEEASTHRD